MDNISGSAKGWNEDDRKSDDLSESKTPVKKSKNIKLNINGDIKDINKVLHSLENKYNLKADKNLYDTMTNLKLALSSLEKVK